MYPHAEKHLINGLSMKKMRQSSSPENRNMGTQWFYHFSVTSSWIFVFFLPPVFSKLESQLHLGSTVFVNLANKELRIEYELKSPENHTTDSLKCFDPFKSVIYSCVIPAGQAEYFTGTMELKNLTQSGEYSCSYKTTTVYWFLRVRDKGYNKQEDNRELITVSCFTSILLVFCVIGSAIIFRGYWKEGFTQAANICRKQKQNGAEKKGKQIEKKNENEDVRSASSTSVYASLDSRPRSIYDALDCPPANTDQRNVKPQKNDSENKMVQERKPPREDIFESVYENF
ncbi:NFAT activation molecule 1 [Antennarius striatus]|uniref:NFAT activation molecule 1 n=1 Tax=Antennarius striatus TaxID=241820 RepID=UPI0035B49533